MAPTRPPNATIPVEPFKLSIPDSDLKDLKTLLKLSKLPPATYEGLHRKFGVTSAWMKEAKQKWEEFDWRAHEKEINDAYPQFIATVKDKDGLEFKIHFAGIFSDSPDAVNLLLLHGWPGCFLEFLPLVKILRESTSPAFNIIIPNEAGYGFSSKPPLDRDFGMKESAYLMNELMVGLGYESSGYIVQGGDIGSFLSRILSQYPSCRGIHLNMCITLGPKSDLPTDLSPIQKLAVKNEEEWKKTGGAYGMEHATRPSTIGHVLASNPLALLAWNGEKFLEWTDEDPSIELILKHVTFWWLTETFPTAIYTYREMFGTLASEEGVKLLEVKKPFGFSGFPFDLVAGIEPIVKQYLGDPVYFKQHESGGHFPAFERPKELAEDIVAFISKL